MPRRLAQLGLVVAALSCPLRAADLQQVEEEVARRLESGSPEGALHYLRQEIEVAPDAESRARMLWISAWIELQSERPQAADLDLREAARLAPHLPFPAVYGDELRDRWYQAVKSVGNERERQAYGLVTDALADLEAGRRDAARRGLQAGLRAVPDHPEALYNLALLDFEDGRQAEAIAGFEKLEALASTRPDSVSTSTRTAALSNLGALYAERGLPEEAERVLERALELEPRQRTAWIHLGRLRRSSGRLEGAREAFERAREISPGDAGVADELALTLGDLGRWSEAITLLQEATRTDPGSPILWLHLGRAHQHHGAPAEARRAFEEALRLDPDQSRSQGAMAALHLAALEWSQGAWEASFRAAARATDLDPKSSTAWIYRGLGHEKRNELQPAREAFEVARDLDPRRGEAWANLARVAESLSDRDAALEAYARAADLDPSLPGVRDGFERLSSGGPLSSASSAPPRSSAGGPPPVTRVRLGLRIADVDYAALGISGLLVENVEAGGLAERSGLRADDLLLRVDGRPLSSLDQLRQRLEDSAGRPVSIDLLRSQRPMTVSFGGTAGGS